VTLGRRGPDGNRFIETIAYTEDARTVLARLAAVERTVGNAVERVEQTPERLNEGAIGDECPTSATTGAEEAELPERMDVPIDSALWVHAGGNGERLLRPLAVGLI
jgi:hypothetical protein